MDISGKKINNCEITKVLDHINYKPSKVQGYDFLQSSNIYQLFLIFAMKNSGKSSLIYRMMEGILNNNCETVYIYCSTMFQDPIYKKMAKMLESKGIEVIMRDTFMIDKKKTYIDEFINERDEEQYRLDNPEPEEEKKPKEISFIKFNEPEENAKHIEKKNEK